MSEIKVTNKGNVEIDYLHIALFWCGVGPKQYWKK